jgi:hypothetical protein
VGVFQRHVEGYAAVVKSTGKLDGKRIGVGRIDVGIPAHGGMALGVWQGCRVLLGLEEDLRSVADDDGKKGVLIRLLVGHFKTKFVAVESDGLIDVADDEEG